MRANKCNSKNPGTVKFAQYSSCRLKGCSRNYRVHMESYLRGIKGRLWRYSRKPTQVMRLVFSRWGGQVFYLDFTAVPMGELFRALITEYSGKRMQSNEWMVLRSHPPQSRINILTYNELEQETCRNYCFISNNI
jgi:hypothetical protein